MVRTAEIFTVGSDGRLKAYAGYAKFGRNGEYLGSRGGYKNGNKASNTNQRNYNETKNGGSRVQNSIRTAGPRGKARNSQMY